MTPQLNRRYQKVITNYNPCGPRLEMDALSTIYPNEQTLFSVPLCFLQANEINLHGGRFVLYVDTQLPYEVITNVLELAATYAVAFEERLNWIAQNNTSSWNFTIEVPHLGANAPCLIIWSFECLDDALLFKLTF